MTTNEDLKELLLTLNKKIDSVEREICGLRSENKKITKAIAEQDREYRKMKEENKQLMDKVSVCENKKIFFLIKKG